jgi:hypothetical protein
VKAFVTGSQAYGEPNQMSDIDLVVWVTPAALAELRAVADPDPKTGKGTDSDPGGPGDVRGETASLRFGKLNLICVTDAVAWGVWFEGTAHLVRRARDSGRPVTRNDAIAFFRQLRATHGLATEVR